MKSHAIVPNVITFGAVISACGKGSQTDQAVRIFQALKEQCVVPNLIIYNAVVSVFEKGRSSERAMKTF